MQLSDPLVRKSVLQSAPRTLNFLLLLLLTPAICRRLIIDDRNMGSLRLFPAALEEDWINRHQLGSWRSVKEA
ncbi:hypothetical protein AAC387_Pa01g2206 [Persea americana]